MLLIRFYPYKYFTKLIFREIFVEYSDNSTQLLSQIFYIRKAGSLDF